MKRKLMLLLACLFVGISLVTAQTQKVTGVVISEEDGQPVVGASVLVKGTTQGTITDIDGNFNLANVPSSAKTLQISYIGMQTQEVAIKPMVKVTLKSDAQNLDEVIVVAYGTAKKSSFTGSAAVIKADKIVSGSKESFDKALSGKMAGVRTASATGDPGSMAEINIRGVGSISASKSPLYVIDGVVTKADDDMNYYGKTQSVLSTLNPEDIESMTVLKDAAAASLYGSRAANGVIIITTKKGKEGKTNVSYSGEVGWNKMAVNAFNMMGSADLIDYTRESLANCLVTYGITDSKQAALNNIDNGGDMFIPLLDSPATVADFIHDPSGKVNTNWKKEIYRTAFTQDHQVSINGGSSKTQFYAGVGYNKSEGIVLGSDFERISGRLNVNHKVNNWLNVALKQMIAATSQDGFRDQGDQAQGMGTSSPIGILFAMDPTAPVKNEDGSYSYTTNRVGNEVSTDLNSTNETAGDRRIYLEAMVDYNRTFGRHDVNAMLLYNQDELVNNVPGNNLINSLPKRKQGLAGRLSYAYDGKYMAEVNMGYNGSENFAKGHRWGFFPSIALGYNISEESFFEPLRKVITSMKLRGSWGLVGNDQIGGERFIYMPTINLSGKGFTTGIDQNYGLSGPVYTRYENNSITWEVGEKINLGIDLQLLNSLNIVVDIFRETRRDIFQKKGTIPTYLGTGNTDVFGNLAEMKNQGLDLSIDYNKAFSKDFYMNFKGTFTYAHNEITKYDEVPKYAFQSKVGQSANVSQGYLSNGLFLDEAEIDRYNQQMGSTLGAGDIKYLNVSNMHGYGDDIVDVDDWTWIGNPTVPEIVYGFGPSFKYKNWDFSFFFQGVAKTSLFMTGFHPFGDNSLRNVLQYVANDRWSPTNQNVDAKYPRLTRKTSLNNTNPGNSGRTSDYWMRDGSFLKLKNMELGYTFKRMRFYISGSNLLTFSKFDLWDPEQGGGSGLKYPTQRVFNVGFQMTFNN